MRINFAPEEDCSKQNLWLGSKFEQFQERIIIIFIQLVRTNSLSLT